MYQRITESVSVTLDYQSSGALVAPTRITWKNKDYIVKQLGLHHVYKEGKTLFHVFSVATETLFMRLVLNTDTLHWRLEEVADAGATLYK